MSRQDARNVPNADHADEPEARQPLGPVRNPTASSPPSTKALRALQAGVQVGLAVYVDGVGVCGTRQSAVDAAYDKQVKARTKFFEESRRCFEDVGDSLRILQSIL